MSYVIGTGTWILHAAQNWKVVNPLFFNYIAIADNICRVIRSVTSLVSGIILHVLIAAFTLAPIGLDIVPLHPDLQNVGSPDLASRITWVQHNL